MNDLKPLVNTGEISESTLRQLFAHFPGGHFPRILEVFRALGPLSSYRVANVLHLGLQKGNEMEVLEGLEKWCEIVPFIPDPVTVEVETRLFFDVLYGSLFMTEEDTVNGVGPFQTVTENGLTFKVPKPSGIIILPRGRR